MGREDPLEKVVETHFSVLAWKITGTEETDSLQSMRLKRVGHDRSANTQAGKEAINIVIIYFLRGYPL